MQGALACMSGVWQRMDNPDAEGFNTWIMGSKSPKGHFKASDGRWIHNWVPNRALFWSLPKVTSLTLALI